MLTNKMFVEIFRPWFVAYQNPPIATKEQIDVYVQALSQFTVEELTACAEGVLKTRTNVFFPKPPEIIKFIMDNKNMTPEAAWATVSKFIRDNPAGTPYSFDDPRITRIIAELGGLTSLRFGSDARRQFVARYKELLNVL